MAEAGLARLRVDKHLRDAGSVGSGEAAVLGWASGPNHQSRPLGKIQVPCGTEDWNPVAPANTLQRVELSGFLGLRRSLL